MTVPVLVTGKLLVDPEQRRSMAGKTDMRVWGPMRQMRWQPGEHLKVALPPSRRANVIWTGSAT